MSVPLYEIKSNAAWIGSEMQRSREWIHELTRDERDAISCAIDRSGSGSTLAIERAIASWRRTLQFGRGFVLVRGMPIDRHDAKELYAWIGAKLGDAVPQNSAGDLLCDIRDTGADANDPNIRLYQTNAEQDFHTDAADLIGLLCLKTAKSGGTSRIVSSVSVYNALVAKRPELVPLLFEDWCFHLHGQHREGMPRYFTMPICRWDGTHLMSFFIGWYIRRAQLLDEVPKLTPAQQEVLELYEQTANDPRLYLDMDFEPGDMQWLKNSVTLHKRTAYVDHAEPSLKRHLLRLWITAHDFADGDELLRVGIDPEKAGDYAS